MNFLDTGFSLTWITGGWLLSALILYRAVKTAPWHKISQDKGAQHVFLGFSVVLFFLWHFGAILENGINFHFILVTLATLMFGWQFAIFSALLATIGLVIMNKIGMQVMALNWLLQGVLPALITWWMAKWAFKRLDRSFFVFVFLNGFLAACIASLATLTSSVIVLVSADILPWITLKQEFVQFMPMLILPEGFINGMLVAALILLRPEWLSCFCDEHFLKGK